MAADKGFLIQDLLVPIECVTNVTIMPLEDVVVSKKITQLRVHVERAIGWVKEYRILQGVISSCNVGIHK